MRHGEASFDARNDDERELTDYGRAKVESNILVKKTELAGVQLVLSSPIRRALQTASLALSILDRKDTIQEVHWLIHESAPLRSIASLAKLKVDSVLLFSHQPFASRFVEILCDLELGAIAMNTASMIAMEVEPVAAGFGNILWQLS